MFTPTKQNANFFTDITSRIMAIRTKPQSGQEIVEEIDALEYLIYQKINEILKTSDIFNNPTFDDFLELDKILKQLFELRIMYPFLYFKEINKQLIPKGYTMTPESFMSEQFNFFIKHCLDLSELPTNQQLQIYVLIVQIMSRPIGQRLIVRLNQMKQHSEKIIKLKNYLGGNSSASLLTKALQPSKNSEISSGTPAAGFFLSYKRFKNNIKYKKVIIHFPKNAYERIPLDSLDYGKQSNFAYKPLFISFAHELIHTLHFLHGRDRQSMCFDERHGKIIENLFVSNVEELWTIDLGRNLSENKLRKEWGLDQRYSHIPLMKAFRVEDSHYEFKYYCFNDVQEIQAEIQNRLAMQTW